MLARLSVPTTNSTATHEIIVSALVFAALFTPVAAQTKSQLVPVVSSSLPRDEQLQLFGPVQADGHVDPRGWRGGARLQDQEPAIRRDIVPAAADDARGWQGIKQITPR